MHRVALRTLLGKAPLPDAKSIGRPAVGKRPTTTMTATALIPSLVRTHCFDGRRPLQIFFSFLFLFSSTTLQQQQQHQHRLINLGDCTSGWRQRETGPRHTQDSTRWHFDKPNTSTNTHQLNRRFRVQSCPSRAQWGGEFWSCIVCRARAAFTRMLWKTFGGAVDARICNCDDESDLFVVGGKLSECF